MIKSGSKIENVIRSSIQNKVKSAFYGLLCETASIIGGGLWPDCLPKPDSFADLENGLAGFALNLHVSALLPKDERKKHIEAIRGKARTARSLFFPIYLYRQELSIYESILTFHDCARDFEETPRNEAPSGITEAATEERCRRYIGLLADYLDEGGDFEVIGEVLSAVPLKMAREKYYRLVAEAFNDNAEYAADVRHYAAALLAVFYPPPREGYGDIFGEVKTDLAKLRKGIDCKTFPDNLDELLSAFDTLTDTVSELYGYAETVYETTRRAELMLTAADYTEKMLLGDARAKDLLLSLKEKRGSNDFDAFHDSIIEECDGKRVAFAMKAYDADERIIDFLQTAETVTGEKKALDGYAKIARLYDADLTADCYAPDTSNPLGDMPDLTEPSADCLIRSVQDAQKGLSPHLCRELRRLFLKAVHPALRPDDMYEILYGSLSSPSKDGHKRAAEYFIAKTLGGYGIETEEEG
jgi:hypothetical protein